MGDLTLKRIAHIRTDFPEKFGVPRQSGLADTKGEIIFEPEYGSPEALRGIEEYSHLWILWGFSETMKAEAGTAAGIERSIENSTERNMERSTERNTEKNTERSWHPTVRPPRLGGNQRVGVFATRSPFRPNPIGLSCVRLERVERRREGLVLCVEGVDMTDGTPVYDIKPYLPYVDAHPEASESFAGQAKDYELAVDFPECWLEKVPQEHRAVLRQILMQDPRPSYQEDPHRVYGMTYAGLEVKFTVTEGILMVCGVEIKAEQKI